LFWFVFWFFVFVFVLFFFILQSANGDCNCHSFPCIPHSKKKKLKKPQPSILGLGSADGSMRPLAASPAAGPFPHIVLDAAEHADFFLLARHALKQSVHAVPQRPGISAVPDQPKAGPVLEVKIRR
jgi:hypothetical protein